MSYSGEGKTVGRDWTGTEIIFSLFLTWLFWPSAVYAGLKGLGVEHWYYGENAPELATRMELWVCTFALPFQVFTFPLVLSAFSGTRLDQLGLTRRRFGRNVLAGVAGLLVLAPPVFGINMVLRYLYSQGGQHIVEQHALEKIAQEAIFPGEWIMLFFTAMAAAPLVEEITFRGVLQPWFARRRWGGHAAMLGAFALTLRYCGERLLNSVPAGISAVVAAAAPVLFVLALLPVYLLVWWFSRTPVAPALFGTSLLFACIHTSVWPTPIPLFVLALGLGILAQSTRSLVGPIVLHSLFNSISCVQLLLRW